MPSLDDVYRKFGETAEAAQLLETELGNMLLTIEAVNDSLLGAPDRKRASELLTKINRHTLGQLLERLDYKTRSLDELEYLLSNALGERNRLFHSFYRHHNFRRNSDEGRTLMLKDLQSIHDAVLEAYKAIMLLSGVDLDAAVQRKLPTRHLPV